MVDLPQVDFSWEKGGKDPGGKEEEGKSGLVPPAGNCIFGAKC